MRNKKEKLDKRTRASHESTDCSSSMSNCSRPKNSCGKTTKKSKTSKKSR